MNTATARWEKLGAKVARNEPFWDSKAPAREIEADIKAKERQGATINYSVFRGGNHMYIWSFAYDRGPAGLVASVVGRDAVSVRLFSREMAGGILRYL